MEEVKGANSVFKKKTIELVIFMASTLVEIIFLVFGIAYLFMIGGLFIKSFVTIVGSLIILGGVSSFVSSFKLARSMFRLRRTLEELDTDFEVDLNKDK